MLKSNKILLIFFCSLLNRLENFVVLFNVLNFFFLSVVNLVRSKSKRLNKIWIVFSFCCILVPTKCKRIANKQNLNLKL